MTVRSDDETVGEHVGRTTDRLVISDLSVTYTNGASGVNGVSLQVPEQTVVAILGRNGAGKTSLLRGVAGFLPSERVKVGGSVRLAGRELRGATPVATNKLGMVFVPERDKVFSGLRVEEHIALVARNGSGLDRSDLIFSALERRRKSRAGLLSGGERQMLALAMAIHQNPSVLLVDELSLGLAPVIVKELMVRIREVTTSRGISSLLVEQDAVAALNVADLVYVMDRGQIVWTGAPGETTAVELGRQYLGGSR